MVTGFNTDVEYEGRVFHVQTEDKGRSNPVVESLVYSGGEVVTSVRTSYADAVSRETFTEAEVQRRMETQHQGIIREILSGRFDPEGPKPFGYNIITNRSLDEVVLNYLSHEIGLEQIRLEIETQPILVEGTRPEIRFRVIAEASERPVAGAKIVVKLLSTKDRPREVFTGSTDTAGRCEAKFEIPEFPGASAAALFQADASPAHVEVKQLILKEAPTGEPRN